MMECTSFKKLSRLRKSDGIMRIKLSPIHVASLIFVGLALWFVIQMVAFNSCWDTNLSPSASICDENFLFPHAFHQMKGKRECVEMLKKLQKSLLSKKPTIYIVTPTYARPVQKAELTRLSHTLSLVASVHWIVVEDSENKTILVKNFLTKSKLSYTHLNIPTPLPIKLKKEDPSWLKPKGVLQRNLAINHLRRHTSTEELGVVYFADDDNTYDLELFEEMRSTERVSVWPVGLAGGLMVEKPLVKDGKVVGWNTVWKANRPFPIDMAGFSVNLTLLLEHPEAGFSLAIPRGYQESNLLKSLVRMDQLEPKADNCTKVLVWHTRTEYPKLKQEKRLSKPSDLNIEV